MAELSPSFKDDFIRLKPHDGENESDLVLSTVTDPASMAVTEKVNLLPRTSRIACWYFLTKYMGRLRMSSQQPRSFDLN